MTSKMAYDLTLKTGVSNIELERIISKNPYYSYIYAIRILKDKFELGEKAISKDSYYSWGYAINVLKIRFRLGEKVIVRNNSNTFEYCYEIMRHNHD